MKTRTLGKTGFNISEVGFGAWAIGADWGDAVPEDQATAALHAALDAGMNFIDTADIYGGGRSETIIGKVLKERPAGERNYVATKMGRGEGWNPTIEDIRRTAEESCARLGVDSLDLVQLHCIPTETLKAGQVFDHLEAIKGEGLIKHYGVSVETIEEGLICIDHGGPATLQVIYNLFRQRLTHQLLPAAAASNVGIIARVPLASGVLTGKFSADHNFGENDHRNFNSDGQCFNAGETFAGVPFNQGIEFADELDNLLGNECTQAQRALRWILDHPEVSTVIPGAKNEEQAKGNADAAALASFSKETHESVEALYNQKIDQTVRGVY
ncbi:aldo/keto reductase [Verrucomicrobiales bacterium]|nr:aldo/keto reductase [Verrucomicrobiales bacterium]